MPLYYWNVVCTHYYYVTSVDGVVIKKEYSYSTCDPVQVYAGSITNCSEISGGGAPPPGSGGYTGNTTSAQTLSDALKKIFIKGAGNLLSTDISRLNNAFTSMNNDCMYKNISNQISSRNITMGEVNINSSMIGVAGWSPSGNLSFGGSDLITSENLSHEWFHLAQWKLTGVDIFSFTNKGMAEFENALFADIRRTVRAGGNIDNLIDHTFACYKGGYETYRTEYQNWLKSITQNGSTYPTTINQADFNKWANVFGEVSSYKKTSGYDYSITSYSPITMFSLFNNCQIY